MEHSRTYKEISARLGSAVRSDATPKTFAKPEDIAVGDWVQWVADGHIEAYGGIRRISGNKVVIASAEGLVTAPISEVKLVRKAR